MEYRYSGTASGTSQASSLTPNINPIQPSLFAMNPKSPEKFEILENSTHGTPTPTNGPIGTPTKSKSYSSSSSFPQNQLITSPNYFLTPQLHPLQPSLSVMDSKSAENFEKLENSTHGTPTPTNPPYLMKQPIKLYGPIGTPTKSKSPSSSSSSPQNQFITSPNYLLTPQLDPFQPSLSVMDSKSAENSEKLENSTHGTRTPTNPTYLMKQPIKLITSPSYPLTPQLDPLQPSLTVMDSKTAKNSEKLENSTHRTPIIFSQLYSPIGIPTKSQALSTSSPSPQKQFITSPNYTVKDPFINPGLPLTSTLMEPVKLVTLPLSLNQLVEPGKPNNKPRKRKAPSESSASPQKQLITSYNYTEKPDKLGSCSPSQPLKQLLDTPNDKPRKRKAPSASPQKQVITSPNYTVKDQLINKGLPLTSTLTEPEKLEKTPEICLAYIWKTCKLEEKCANMHYHLPYRWQVHNGSEWKDLPDMEDIESAYSEPGNDSFKTVNFQAMTSDAKAVRRLSTPSSVTKPAHYVLTTKWIWYWRDECDIWIEYGQQNTINVRSSIVSSDLEAKYLSDPKNTFPFAAEKNNYVIDFQEMKQKNTLFETKKEVRRRPKFLDSRNVRLLKGCTKPAEGNFKKTLPDSALNTGTFPPEWDMNIMPKSGYQKVPLNESTDEFRKIVEMFQKTVRGFVVKKLWRIENSFLWKAYCLQKEEMKTRNAGRDVYEELLFHGTKSDNIDVICSENFDWRVCGTNGTVYGEGSYFARDASYSHLYSLKSSSDTLMMIVARVLVGDFVEGNRSMKRPPQKPNGTQRYDSCVDNISIPSIYVVFDKLQIYPQYILEYKKI